MAQRKQVVLMVVLLILVGSVYSMFGGRGGRRGAPSHYYFYDLSSGKVFTAARTALPPIDGPDAESGQGVRAVIVSCGACNAETWQIAYLTKYSPEALAAMAQLETIGDGQADVADSLEITIEEGTLVASVPEDGAAPQWLTAATPAGIEVQARNITLCDDKTPEPCFP